MFQSFNKSVVLFFAYCVPFCFGETVLAQADVSSYTRHEVMIPMRDGINLHTVYFVPDSPSEALPFLLLRTPYGTQRYSDPLTSPSTQILAEQGYIFVYQDIRGRYDSQGVFEMQRAQRDSSDPGSIDESTDAWDTIDWLLTNVPNHNGKVGMYGISYPGWTALVSALHPHPALVAVSEQASPADMFLGDDFFHNGAFRLSYGFEYAYRTEISKTDSLFPFGMYDTYQWYLDLGPLSNVNTDYFKHRLPTWNNFVKHHSYDDFWKKQSIQYRIDSVYIPIQHVGGFWDQEDLYGPQKAYELLEEMDDSNRNFLVLGPWNHGGWIRKDGTKLGQITFGQNTAEYFRNNIQAPWFAYHLKGKGDGKFPEVLAFQTGSNEWKTYETWPPEEVQTAKLYFNPNNQLSFNAPRSSEESKLDSFVSDPNNPVPYRQRPIEATYGPGSRWRTWMVEDQRFVESRPDVLSWTSDILEEDITVTGKVLAHLYAATSGSDADWVVKLIDVYPDEYKPDMALSGYQLMITGDVFRGRFQRSFSQPMALVPDSIYAYAIDLHNINHTFKKGHRIMVQIQSTWFPIIDRNPQTFVPNIFQAEAADFNAAIHRIYRYGDHASYIEIPIVK